MQCNMKAIGSLALAALLALSAVGCSSAPAEEETQEPVSETMTVTNDDLTLSIPSEYYNLLVIETPSDSESGILFDVSEKASVEAAEAQGESGEGAGQLFSISRIGEEEMHEMRSTASFGQEVFAQGEDGLYYVIYYPTDVRYVRATPEDMTKDQDQWTALVEWASTVPETFVADNSGLTAVSFGDTDLDIYLARVAYNDDTVYTLSSTEAGPKEPNGVNAAPFLKKLMEGVTYKVADGVEAPDGEYIVLSFPDEDVRFDFFLADGNYIRQVWSGDNEQLYEAVFDDGATKASDVMNEWYHALMDAAPAEGAAPQSQESNTSAPSQAADPDAMVGTWAEEIAGRGMITIQKGNEAGTYPVHVDWSSSASEMYSWDMVAVPSADGSQLSYKDCKLVIVTHSEEGPESEEVQYENGTGTFSLNKDGKLVWHDNMEQGSDDSVFVKA